MSRLCLVAALCLPVAAFASWYWPFGGDSAAAPARVSELLEPASILIDNASDLAEDGKVDEAVEEYQKALAELARIELENPERAATPEFATLRNKRAYVNSAISSLLLSEARKNAKSVAVTDTADLEKEYQKRQKAKREAKSGRPDRPPDDSNMLVADAKPGRDKALGTAQGIAAGRDKALGRNAPPPAAPATRRDRVKAAIRATNAGDNAAAFAIIDELLAANPGDAAALNLKARIEMATGKYGAAETTLGQCIRSNPRSYYAFYNMARVKLASPGDEEGRLAAKRYYEMGRGVGGPIEDDLEKL